jgi:hypothetical protein
MAVPELRAPEEPPPGAAQGTQAPAEAKTGAAPELQPRSGSFRMGSPPAGMVRPKSEEPGKKEPESGLSRNLREFGQMDPRKMTDAEKVIFLTGGPLGGPAGVNALRGFKEARSEPVVEHVNPNYPPPPCTPQEIVNVQNEILTTLDARAQAEDVAQAAAGQVSHHKANETPLDNMGKGTDEAISATEAHKQAVARRTEANKEKGQKEEKVGEGLSDYTDRAARLTTVTVPMRGFARFTSLAYSLPDDPQVLVGAKHGLIKMNTDAKKFLSQLDQMDGTIKDQKAVQPERKQQVQADAGTLQDTAKKAGESGNSLDEAKKSNEDLGKQNQDKLDEATKLKTDSDQTAGNLGAQATRKQGQAQGLTASLEGWAQNHKQARLAAIEQTKKRMEQEGYKILEVKEK